MASLRESHGRMKLSHQAVAAQKQLWLSAHFCSFPLVHWLPVLGKVHGFDTPNLPSVLWGEH